MDKSLQLHDPWLVAAWPGMGAVAITAGYYLMSKLGMHLLAEFPAREYFNLEHVEVEDGLVLTGRLPRSRLFLWHDPQKQHDLIAFIGEAQPPVKGADFCSQLVGHAGRLGVKRVFTFAAIATQMRAEHDSRVYCAAIDQTSLDDFKHLGVLPMDAGQISGLNGVLLGIAAERGMSGGCLLGEIPSVFSQFPYPQASLEVLKVFTKLADISLDLKELETQSRQTSRGLANFLHQLESTTENPENPDFGAGLHESDEASAPPDQLTPDDRQQLEVLFEIAAKDRSNAYTLKQELDRMKVFQDYEDRFLDLFKNSD